jgi:hypothetical protein
MKLIPVDCWRDGDDIDVGHRRDVVFADTKEEAERLSREVHAGDDFTRFQAQEPVEGPFEGPARVIYCSGRRLTSDSMPAGKPVA